jgi:hypothetical protein
VAVSWDDVREIALALPGVEDGTSYGTPALKRKKKLMIRLKEDGETVVMIVGFDNRELLMNARPEAFFITDHYRNYPSVLMRMAKVSVGEAKDVVGMTWRQAWQKTRTGRKTVL